MKWKQQDATVCIFGTVNCAFCDDASDARRLVEAHNADCDWYEARIAELESQFGNDFGLNFEGMCKLAAERSETIRELRENIAELEAERDAADAKIAALMEMLKDNKPGRIHGVSYYTDAQNKQAELYHRACEIAGREA